VEGRYSVPVGKNLLPMEAKVPKKKQKKKDRSGGLWGEVEVPKELHYRGKEPKGKRLPEVENRLASQGREKEPLKAELPYVSYYLGKGSLRRELEFPLVAEKGGLEAPETSRTIGKKKVKPIKKGTLGRGEKRDPLGWERGKLKPLVFGERLRSLRNSKGIFLGFGGGYIYLGKEKKVILLRGKKKFISGGKRNCTEVGLPDGRILKGDFCDREIPN